MNILDNLRLGPFTEITLTIIVLLVMFALVRIISFGASKLKTHESINETLVYLIKDIIQYSLYIITIILIFKIFGVDLTSVFVSIGIGSIIIGFASKDIISNILSGIFVINDKNIELGDTIESGPIKGKVEKISLRTTTVINNTGIVSIIPNSVLSNKPYKRYNEFESFRVDLISIIPLKIDIEEFKEKILNKIKEYDEINTKKSPNLLSEEITEEGVKVKISVWINDKSQINPVKLKVTNEVRSLINDYYEG